MEIQPEIIAQMLVSLPRDLAKHIVFAGINNNPSNLLKAVLAVCFVANKNPKILLAWKAGILHLPEKSGKMKMKRKEIFLDDTFYIFNWGFGWNCVNKNFLMGAWSVSEVQRKPNNWKSRYNVWRLAAIQMSWRNKEETHSENGGYSCSRMHLLRGVCRRDRGTPRQAAGLG